MTLSAVRVASGQGLRAGRLVGLGFLIRHEEDSGVIGGSSSAGIDNVRKVNTEIVNTITGAFLGVNEFTLPAGTYDVWGHAVVSDNGRHRFILYNKTDASIEIIGTSAYGNATGGFNSGGTSFLRERIVLAGTKLFELRHYTEGTESVGLGTAGGGGFTEVYSTIHFLEV